MEENGFAENQFETPYIRLQIRGEFLYSFYKKGVVIDLEIAQEIVRQRMEFMQGKSMPVIVFDEGVLAMNKAARRYLSSTEGTRLLTAAAIIRRDTFSVVLGNFLILVEKPPMPARICYSEDEGIIWLKHIIHKQAAISGSK